MMPNILTLASYPRSGNTMLRAMLWHCFGLQSVSRYTETLWQSRDDAAALAGVMDMPRSMSDYACILDQQGIIPTKTHHMDAYIRQFPTIYVLRDGRETCYSLWKFRRDIQDVSEATIESVIRGNPQFGSWSQHVTEWIETRKPEKLLILKYEDLLSVFSECVRKVGEFIARTPTQDTMPSFEDFQATYPTFYRSGRVDSWRENMGEDALALFEALHGEVQARHYG